MTAPIAPRLMLMRTPDRSSAPIGASSRLHATASEGVAPNLVQVRQHRDWVGTETPSGSRVPRPKRWFMSRHFIAAGIILWSLSPWLARMARAQELSDAPVLRVSAADVPVQPAAPVGQFPMEMPRHVAPAGPTHLMLPFYVSTAVLQALDVHSTLAVRSHGGVEGNPFLSGLISNRPAFFAVKAGIAASTIYAANRIARHHKVATIAALVSLNSLYALVVSHNYQLAHSLRSRGR
jgi:hypothetical protein